MSKYDDRQTKRPYYIGLFVLFGLVIALSVSIVDYRIETVSIDSKVTRQAKEVFGNKINELENFIFDFENIVTALRDNAILSRYVRDPGSDNYRNLTSLFHTVSASNSALMQVRYLDANGMEKIRVDWGDGMVQPSIIPEGELQDKGHRYYFIEASKVPPHSFWYSKLDLNVENRKIQIPPQPVLRVASPVYVDQKYQGIIIINAHAKSFLEKFRRDPLFDICLVDQEGYLMTSCDGGFAWSRYLESGNTLQTKHPQDAPAILVGAKELELQQYGELFAGAVRQYLQQDGAIVLLQTKADALKNMNNDRQKTALLIVFIIFTLSVPLALLISRGPAKLHKKIADQNRVLLEYIELIDKNVHTCIVDKNGVFEEVSTAFAQTMGYDKNEIIGMGYGALYCSTRPDYYFQKIWKTIVQDKSWSGEVQHLKRNGDCYWADTVIFPQKDDQQNIIGYSAIYHDMTDKKHIEMLSITDVMTGLYNRRFFNTIIEKELKRAQRGNKLLAFAMLDVDYFKQYNDYYGHQKGDQVLKDISGKIEAKLGRASDYCFRLGGEEFGILFTDVQSSMALDFTESIRDAIEKMGIEHKWSKVADVVTVSIGLLSVTPGIGITEDIIYKLADDTLYMAKNDGRNRVVLQNLETQV